MLGTGVAIGLVGAAIVANLLRKQIFGVEPFDAPTLSCAVGLMLATGFAAAWWPANRAASKNPSEALSDG